MARVLPLFLEMLRLCCQMKVDGTRTFRSRQLFLSFYVFNGVFRFSFVPVSVHFLARTPRYLTVALAQKEVEMARPTNNTKQASPNASTPRPQVVAMQERRR